MIPWTLLGSTSIPGGGGELRLSRRDDEFSIKIAGRGGDLMNSRMHHSEDMLAQLGCEHLSKRMPTLGDAYRPRVLIGGLGMGFTLASALQALGPRAEVVVAELVPEVVEWNRGPLGVCAGNPLQDERTRVHVGDVAHLIKSEKQAFDAILLDVDNGPEGLTHKNNDWLYSLDGLAAAAKALRPEGVLAVWSAGPDQLFTIRLRKAGFRVETRIVRARPGKGSRHTIWLAHNR